MASQAIGKSTADNLLMSEDVLSTIKCLKKLGIKVNFNKTKCEIYGNGMKRRDFTHVDDITDGIFKIIKTNHTNITN